MIQLVPDTTSIIKTKLEKPARISSIEDFIPDLCRLMKRTKGIGLASNQVGMEERFFIMAGSATDDFRTWSHRHGVFGHKPLDLPYTVVDGKPYLVVLDPLVWFDDGEHVDDKIGLGSSYVVTEGCLTFPRCKDIYRHLPERYEAKVKKCHWVTLNHNKHPTARIRRKWSCWLRFRGLDDRIHEYITFGLTAEVIQHEIDHLNGITIADRLKEFCNE